MSYQHRFFIFVTASKLATANQLAAQWDPDSGGRETFGSLRLSADGAEPASHYGAATWATDSMRQGITTALGNIPWVGLYSTNPAEPEATYAANWQAALADMGLQVIEEPVG